jgi:V/A-type H+-transporting ATPase subunit I
MLPLPRYGTVDPTPYVAVFFPMLFGIVVGDIGHGLLLGAISALIAWRSPRRGLGRDIAKIGGAMALFTVAFGFLYGEFFGDLGRSWPGLQPIWLDREEAILPFLGFAIALGVAHLLVGLVVGVVASVRGQHRREAFGRGVTLFMLATIVIALLATFEQLPSGLFTPAIIALLVAFPLLIVLEGVAGLIELMAIIGHVLSYARVMALGVASVMLAVVANKMAGAFGSVAIGVVFALLFHLVYFAIGLFSPTIQVLRLHYVEFFDTFFSPGGTQYQPLAHWTPEPVGPS